MATEYTGGCLCGDVRFSCAAQPDYTFFCHCSDCQRTAGSPFSVELMVSSETFSVQGNLQTYTTTGDSGNDVHRHFCPKCGSGVYLECDSDPGYVFIKAGALDDAGWLKPDMHIFTVAKQPWVSLADSLPKFERMPTE